MSHSDWVLEELDLESSRKLHETEEKLEHKAPVWEHPGDYEIFKGAEAEVTSDSCLA